MRSDRAKKKKNKKKKKSGSRFIDFVIVILICVIGFCAFNIGKALYKYYLGTKEYKAIQADAGTQNDNNNIDWKKLQSKYKDIIAWLYQKGTVINYPVAQGSDNSYYLTHLLSGEYNFKGTLFVDVRNKDPFNDFMTVIYGHRMKDFSMFWTIGDYRRRDYWIKHPTMDLSTPKQDYKIYIFACVTIPSSSKLYKFEFKNNKEKADYLKSVLNKTDLQTNVKVNENNKIVMLSTCTYEFENARVVAFGKLVPKKKKS